MNTSLRNYADAYVRSIPSGMDAVKEFDMCAEIIISTKQLQSFLSDVSVPINTRREALKTAFPKAADETINFFSLLAHEGEISQLDGLQTHIRTAAAAQKGKRHALVTTAAPLTAKDLKRIEDALSQKLGSDVSLEEKTDPSLLAGFRINADGWTFDASLKGRLDRLQHALTV